MAATTYERDAKDLGIELADKLTDMLGEQFVLEGSTFAKTLNITGTSNWKKHISFTGDTWRDVWRSLSSAWHTVELIESMTDKEV